MGKKIRVEHLDAWHGSNHVLKDINIEIPANQVTAIIGPSGCGKSTFVRCLNRLHEVVPGARVSGKVFLEELDIYGPNVDPVQIRREVGMVFQRPNPFPAMSIFGNVASGLTLNGLRSREAARKVEESLRKAALWDEVADKLHRSGTSLSGGQQQRLCIARALAVEPDVLLMDEPASALDPIATLRIEDLVAELKQSYTVVIVTHNMQQAARVADNTAFFLNGELIEFGPTSRVFTTPLDQRTSDYITGRFG